MTGIDADALEYLQAFAAFERALAEFGSAGHELQKIFLQWEPIMGTPEGARLASAYGEQSRQADSAMEKLEASRKRWEAIRDRVSVVQAIEAVQHAQVIGHA